MKSYKLIYQLLNLVEDFESENKDRDLTLSEFSGFLINHLSQANSEAAADVRFGDNYDHSKQSAYQIDNTIGRLFIYISR